MSSLKTAQELGKAGFDKEHADALAKCIHDYSISVSMQIAELGTEIRQQLEEHKA